MTEAGYRVIYFNYDISSGDFKRDYQMAVDYGFKLLADVDPETPMPAEKILEMIQKMAGDPDADMTKHILIFDTLKKFTDVMCKKAMKTFMSVCRAITNKGGTVILSCQEIPRPRWLPRVRWRG
jgi:hypothetical protein